MNTVNLPPSVTCALSIVRDCIELAPASRAVAASAFVVTDDTVSTAFDVRTAVILPGLSRQQSIEHIARMIPHGARIIMRSPRLPRGLVRHLSKGRPMPAPTDAQALAALRPGYAVAGAYLVRVVRSSRARWDPLSPCRSCPNRGVSEAATGARASRTACPISAPSRI